MITKDGMIKAITDLKRRYPDNYKAICVLDRCDILEWYIENFTSLSVEFEFIEKWLNDRVVPSGFDGKFNRKTTSGTYNHIINDWCRWRYLSSAPAYIRSSSVIVFFASSGFDYDFNHKSDPVAVFKLPRHIEKERFVKQPKN